MLTIDRSKSMSARLAAGIAAVVALNAMANAQSSITERLGDGSTYKRENCVGVCACPVVASPYPMTGTFTLVFDHADEWTSYYLVTGVDFATSTVSEPEVHFAGSGTYHIGGDFALTQHLVLDLVQVGNATPLHFDSGEVVITGGGVNFPAVSISATTGITGCTRRTFVINAAPGAAACAADVGSAGGAAGPDGQLDNNDFIVFINEFFNGDASADRGSAGGIPGSDGQFDNNDFIVFINQFFAGC